jgi:hypothetical protein
LLAKFGKFRHSVKPFAELTQVSPIRI